MIEMALGTPANVLNIGGVECYEKDGTAYRRLETVARGLGFTQTQTKNGVKYTSVRWERVEDYLAEIGFPHKWGKDDFIPENVFYRLAMKAKNAAAEAFQAKIADVVIPAIRKHGMYATPAALDKLLSDPDFAIRVFQELKESRAQTAALAKTNKALVGEKEALEVQLNQSEKFWTIMKFNQRFKLGWNMRRCQSAGKQAAAYSRQHGYEIRKCRTNDDRFESVNSYAFEALERLFL